MNGPAGADVTGFGVGEVRAVRTFRLGRDGGLYPLYDDRAWTAGVNTAWCKRDARHAAPEPDCRCGLYAYGHQVWCRAQPPSRSVLAVVAVSGAVEVATRGVRAEYGRIEAVWLHRRVSDELCEAVRVRYPRVPVVRDREALLRRFPLTVLEGYRAPRLTGRTLQRVMWLLGALAGLVLLIGCLPAEQLITSRFGALVWTAAVAVTCLAVVTGLGMRSAAVGTAAVVGLGWMLTTTAQGAAAMWLSRVPLLVAAVLCALVWCELAAVGRTVPGRRQVIVRSVTARLRRRLS